MWSPAVIGYMPQHCDDRQLRVRAGVDEAADWIGARPAGAAQGFHDDRATLGHITDYEVPLEPRCTPHDANGDELVDELPRTCLAYADCLPHFQIARASLTTGKAFDDKGQQLFATKRRPRAFLHLGRFPLPRT